MRIAIFGAGGVGCWLGGRLQQAGVEVVFIARGPHGEALRQKGLRLEVGAGDSAEVIVLEKVQVYADTASAAAAGVSVDCCILCVKTFQVEEAAKASAAILSHNGFIVTTQNGVDAPREAAAVLGPERVVCGSCKVLAFVDAPGVACVAGQFGTFTFGEVFDASGSVVADARSPRVEALRSEVAKARGITLSVGSGEGVPSMWMALWEKAVGMCSFGPVGALTRASMDGILACEESKALLRSAMLEVLHVADKSGFCVAIDPEAFIDGMLGRMGLMTGSTTSTTRDVIMGKPSEVRELSGAIVRAAKRLGTSAPTHELIVAALLPQERRARGEYHYELKGVPLGAPHVQSRL